MGRQSGFFTFAASIPLATVVLSLICLSHLRVSADPDHSNSRPNSPAVLRYDDENAAVAASQGTDFRDCGEFGFLLTVPKDALVVVGSLDVTGAPHRVAFHSGPFDERFPSNADSLDRNSSDNRPVPCLQRLSLADFAASSDTGAATLGTEQRHSSTHADTHADRMHELPQVATFPSDRTLSRRFLVPHFEHGISTEEATNAALIAQTPRVSVYLDDSLRRSGSAEEIAARELRITARASELCGRLESELLDHVGHWIGEILDLDGDNHLTVVITDLDRRQMPFDNQVFGCVRDRDFFRHHESDLSGDILYLDSRIPEGNALAALLTHELTHAAVCCLILQSPTRSQSESLVLPPPWLNEAIAHLVEETVADQPIGFAERGRQFHANTAACPIVASESYMTFADRRGGCRASATLFLQQFAGSPETLRFLIQDNRPIDQTVKSVTGRLFSDVFRTWSVHQARLADRFQAAQALSLAGNATVSRRIFGTAFLCFRCEEAVENLRITSDRNAALQVTVINQSR